MLPRSTSLKIAAMLAASVASAVFFVSQVAAHGIMTWPIIRMLPQDQQDGYTFSMGAENTNLGSHPAADTAICNFLPAGPVFTQTMAPGAASIDWNIMNSHQGGCIVYLSQDGEKTWQQVGADPTCGVRTEASSGQGTIAITLPQGTYSGVLRWTYTANNGGIPEEQFSSCSDIRVAPTGSNLRSNYLLLSQSAPSQLPQDGNNYWDQSCKTGAFQCGPNKAFIAQCVSLAASGSWTGGSSWYQYQCPHGTTCQTVSGMATCK
ncbi:hypothetical protein HDU98_010044 [Podochytrium sp. JEL0797]|nr:hypothetical protein HDU98_010044 [Podochytrium sp. JEL0797]